MPANQETLSSQRFVFIGGLHRSGTTTLFRALRTHAAVGAFPYDDLRRGEGQYLQSVYTRDSHHGGPGSFGFDPAAHLTEESSLVSNVSRTQLLAEWASHWDSSRPVLLEKSPPNLIRTRFLQALFPDSSFVILVRHPVAVSLATLKWQGWPRYTFEQGTTGGAWTSRPAEPADIERLRASEEDMLRARLYTLFEHWAHCHRTFVADASRLNRCLVLRYEDFVAAPEESLGRLWRFLEWPLTIPLPALQLTDHNPAYFDRWRELGERILPPSAVAHISARCERELSAFGYGLGSDDLVRPM